MWSRSSSGTYAYTLTACLGIVAAKTISGDGNATAPLAPTAVETGGAPSASTCNTETQCWGAHAGEQTGASGREQTRENRRGHAERAGGRGAGWDATTRERLVERVSPATTKASTTRPAVRWPRPEPPLTGTVWDAVIAATVEHACTTHGAEVPASDPGPRALPETALGVPTRTDRTRHRAGQRVGGLHPAQHVHRTAKPRRARRRALCPGRSSGTDDGSRTPDRHDEHPRHPLCAALEHEPAYPAGTIDCLTQRRTWTRTRPLRCLRMFEDVTRKPPRPRIAC